MWQKKKKLLIITENLHRLIITASHQFLSTTGQNHTGQGNTDW